MTTNYRDESMQQELLTLLAARKGHFRLESGHHRNLWLDLEPLFLWPKRLGRFAIELANGLSRYNIGAVCGPLFGGAFLAQAVASVLDVEFYYTERFVSPQHDALYPVRYRIPSALRYIAHEKDVAIVDDVINAGSAVRRAFAELQLRRKTCGYRRAAHAGFFCFKLLLGSEHLFGMHRLPSERFVGAIRMHAVRFPNTAGRCRSTAVNSFTITGKLRRV